MEDLIEIISSNAFTILNTMLLVFSLIFAFRTRMFQKKTAVRESIEQLDDYRIKIGKFDFKIKPAVRRFNYSQKTTVIELQILRTIENHDSLSTPTYVHADLENEHREYISTQINKIDRVTSANFRNNKSLERRLDRIFIEMNTADPVESRHTSEMACVIVEKCVRRIRQGDVEEIEQIRN